MPDGSEVHRTPRIAGPRALQVLVRPDTREPAAARLVVLGDLDLLGAPELTQCVEQQVQSGLRTLVLDLGGSSFCDARGLAALLDARNRVRAVGGTLVIVGASELLRRAISVTGLDDELPVVADVATFDRSG